MKLGTYRRLLADRQTRRPRDSGSSDDLLSLTKKFYADVMGFAVTQDYGKGSARWVNVSIPNGHVTLTLTTYLGNHLQPGTMSLYVATPDVQRAHDELTAKGVEVTEQISDDLYGPGSGVRWFRCADPDGNVLTFAQSK